MATERKKPTGEKRLAQAQADGYLTVSKGQPYTADLVARWGGRCEAQGRPAIHAVVGSYEARVVAVFDHLGVMDASQAREIAATLQGVEGGSGRDHDFGGEYKYAGGGVVVRQRPEIELRCSLAAVAEVARLLNDRILDMVR